MKSKQNLLAIFITLIVVLSACRDNETDAPALVGTWIAPELGTTELTILPNNEFICKTNVLIHLDSTNYSVIRGTVKVKGYKLELNIAEVESSNVFYPDRPPIVLQQSGALFRECTYMLIGDRLELNYIQHSTDVPLPARLTLYRKK